MLCDGDLRDIFLSLECRAKTWNLFERFDLHLHYEAFLPVPRDSYFHTFMPPFVLIYQKEVVSICQWANHVSMCIDENL
jgi:hypothetical protein